jgi:hypothetical protein
VTEFLNVDESQSLGFEGETGPEIDAAVWEWLVGNPHNGTLAERIANAQSLGRTDRVEYLESHPEA